jgi:hypothetical protein
VRGGVQAARPPDGNLIGFAGSWPWLWSGRLAGLSCGDALLYAYNIPGFRPLIVTEQVVLDLVTLGKGAEAVSLNL